MSKNVYIVVYSHIVHTVFSLWITWNKYRYVLYIIACTCMCNKNYCKLLWVTSKGGTTFPIRVVLCYCHGNHIIFCPGDSYVHPHAITSGTCHIVPTHSHWNTKLKAWKVHVDTCMYVYVEASMELGPEDVSLLERCLHFRGCYVQASVSAHLSYFSFVISWSLPKLQRVYIFRIFKRLKTKKKLSLKLQRGSL